MELSDEIKKDLKCSICTNYLTITPIMVQPNGNSICGRCSPPKEEKHLVIRNNAFEKLASSIIFPCQYQTQGCNFNAIMSELEEHERFCDYHKLKCPILPSGSCSWVDVRKNLTDHFRSNHNELLITHPCDVKPNTTKSYEQNMITSFAEKIFLIQIKYNISSAKFWHNVRLIDNSSFTENYEYNFEISGEKGIFSNKYKVLPQDFFQIYDDPQKEISIENLLNLVGQFDNLTFKITLLELDIKEHCTDCQKDFLKGKLINGICADCNKVNTVPPNNQPGFTKCNKNNCLYYDKDINVRKHQVWFCDYAENVCSLCESNVSDLFNHYFNVHKTNIHFSSLKLQNLSMNVKYIAFVIQEDVIFLCKWQFTRSHLEFKIISSLSKTVNEKYDCFLKLVNPRNKFQKKYVLPRDNNINYDWLANIKLDIDNPVVGIISGTTHLFSSNVIDTYVKNEYNLELSIVKK